EGNLSPMWQRFADLFGLEMYQELLILDMRQMIQQEEWPVYEPPPAYKIQPSLLAQPVFEETELPGQLIQGDSLTHLRQLPASSVDFSFIDPPYNLGKNYNSYNDDLSIQEYFSWCDEWITEVARILKPGRTVAILNIPIWAVRHFLFMESVLRFQNWITWDALSFPVRKIMPANYAIVCFSKGEARPLPGLLHPSNDFNIKQSSPSFFPLHPLAENYCLRRSCVKKRNALGLTDRGPLTDLWWDIHRLKHNSRRVDHPCQLPPQLLYRLISLFTEPGETVLDCFNGAGTTTLTAHQMGRRFIGIELSEKYHQIAEERHQEIMKGMDPFRKADRKLTEKNSRVPRMPKRQYEIPKRTLQLEVRRVAQEIGHIPLREEMIQFGKYDIKYYDDYFSSWGEVCAAARHDGMSEVKADANETNGNQVVESTQLSLFDRGVFDAKQ
ncbi:MAG: DNA methyltransferase, partial [Anaerolineae bacterium]